VRSGKFIHRLFLMSEEGHANDSEDLADYIIGSGVCKYTENGVARRYEGEFHRNKFHGEGRMYIDDEFGSSLCYEGKFQDGEYHGKGKKYYTYSFTKVRIPSFNTKVNSKTASFMAKAKNIHPPVY
jgi:hypothetical protein